MGNPPPVCFIALLCLLAIGDVIEAQANFLSFGNGDVINPISDDGGSQAIPLQQPFRYFGRVYNQIYVNNNGLLTFTQPLSAYIPYSNAGIDVIEPLWTDLNNVYGGTISYRQDTSSAVLAQVTAAVNQYFPQVLFSASSVFVATWDRVPYYNNQGTATFQVILASNSDRSFILFNYGSITQTGQRWLAGYDTVNSANSFSIPGSNMAGLSSSSNVNVNGRWSFHVDGSPGLPSNFLPYSNGEVVNPVSDDGGSQAISLQQPFRYFGRVYNQIYVNNNGLLTFTQPLSAYIPYSNAGIDVIEPLWTDLNNVYGGTISYRQDTSSAVLAQVTAAVNQYFPQVPFSASSVFVATWDRVPYYNNQGVATFQVILASSGGFSFVLMNYGNVAQTTQSWLAGYETMDSYDSFTIPGASPADLSSSSNVNVNGRWSFHVDQSSHLPPNFLPYGNGEVVNPISDDGGSQAISLQQPFRYFGRVYNQIYVNNNGLLTFTQPLSAYIPYLNAGIDVIEPLWTDLNNVNGGTISYRQDTSSAVLAQVTAAVNQYFPQVLFSASSVFVATWDRVPYYSGGTVTFQVILASGGEHSFILFNYGDIAQTSQSWLAGYDTVDSAHSFTISVASPPELSSNSNINMNGLWSFRVDGTPDLPPYFLPYSNEEVINPLSDDGSSQAISLQQPFEYFGRIYNQIYVNNNGLLTFTQPLSAYIPYSNAGIDVIEPLWTDLNNVYGGTISYRQDTSSAVLAQVTAAVNQYFPHVPFSASSVFVATWDRVPYYSGGLTTFQVILASNGGLSFILFNYGDIAQTGQTWRAGYDTVDFANSFSIPGASPAGLSSSSNVNVNGSWSFHVDGSPDYPPNFLPFGDGDIINLVSDDGSSQAIPLQQPFQYFEREYNQIYVNNNGLLTFTQPLSAYIPYLNAGIDVIEPLWTDLNNVYGGTISYRQDTSSAVLAQVTAAVNQYFPNRQFNASSAFVATWERVPYYSNQGVVTFQVVLAFSDDRSYVLFNYGNVAPTGQVWMAGYDTVDSSHSFNISLSSASQLSSSSNVLNNGRWVFQVDDYDVCFTCTENETCQERAGIQGCVCANGQRPNPAIYDAVETCVSSSGSMSLSRCQLFESGFIPETLHLNDPSCRGTVEDGRLLFNFDNEGHVCGTILSSNRTHFIYQNSILSSLEGSGYGIISREGWMNMTFSCVYPLIQTLSMAMGIQVQGGQIYEELPGQGTYQIRMIPYQDAEFTLPFDGQVEIEVNQPMYVAVEVDGVDGNQLSTVLDNCWATPVDDMDYSIRWSLIVRECPNEEDGTVEVLQNGVGLSSRFSFRMFTFTGISDRIFLHCQVHLCLVQNGRCVHSCEPGNRRRRRRSSDFHHSAAITVGL